MALKEKKGLKKRIKEERMKHKIENADKKNRDNIKENYQKSETRNQRERTARDENQVELWFRKWESSQLATEALQRQNSALTVTSSTSVYCTVLHIPVCLWLNNWTTRPGM